MNYSAENNLPFNYQDLGYLKSLAALARGGKPGSPVPTTPAISNLKVVAASLPSSSLSKLFPKKLDETPSDSKADNNKDAVGAGKDTLGASFASATKVQSTSTKAPETASMEIAQSVNKDIERTNQQAPISTQAIVNNFPKEDPFKNINFGGGNV